jgi:hypothetical protein
MILVRNIQYSMKRKHLKILSLIEETEFEINKLKPYANGGDISAIEDACLILSLFKRELLNNPWWINRRVKRSIVNLGMSAYKDFENTPVETKINELIEAADGVVFCYIFLCPLGEDFGTKDPI